EEGADVQDADLELEVRHLVRKGRQQRLVRAAGHGPHRAATHDLHTERWLEVAREEDAVRLRREPRLLLGEVRAVAKLEPSGVATLEAEVLARERDRDRGVRLEAVCRTHLERLETAVPSQEAQGHHLSLGQ